MRLSIRSSSRSGIPAGKALWSPSASANHSGGGTGWRSGAVEHEGVTGPVWDLERGGVGGLEGDAGAQPGVPAQPHLSVPVQSRGQIRQLVVDEREDIGDLDPVVEEEQVESPQIRRGGGLDRNRGPVPAVSGSAGR